MNQEDRAGNDPTLSLASALELLPILVRSFPVLSPLLEDLKVNFRVKSKKLLGALPSIAESLKESDQNTTEKLAKQLFEIFPDLGNSSTQGKR